MPGLSRIFITYLRGGRGAALEAAVKIRRVGREGETALCKGLPAETLRQVP